MTDKHIWLRISTLVALIIFFSAASRAQSVLTDDTSTTNSLKDADSNFGTNPNLTVASGSNTYLKFKPFATLHGADVARATLKLYVGNVSSAGAIDLYQAGGTWSE